MKALSIRQPWAWLIIHAGKDIENRNWKSHYRGPLLIHASSGLTRREYDAVRFWVSQFHHGMIPSFEAMQRGGVVGMVDVVDCVTKSTSPWFEGPYGYVLSNPKPLPFTKWSGQLGFFDIPESSLITL